ncbi:hypothetical protein GCM10010946_09500 [Undibacterium squillarum]|uniref:Uncharacterized protein n=1 Tax=Undibacterium squillarum TaxID=1131567 RepID=A0ABQ2XV04_9BURK|nr:hypothetical protein GCM10010946_09500 [Undibacterium squillarum]
MFANLLHRICQPAAGESTLPASMFTDGLAEAGEGAWIVFDDPDFDVHKHHELKICELNRQ